MAQDQHDPMYSTNVLKTDTSMAAENDMPGLYLAVGIPGAEAI